ncbi:MAG: DUF4142 domain-containing protein [Burkholderiaceae bacterium]
MIVLHRALILGCGVLCASAVHAAGAPAPEKFLATAMQDGIAEIAACRMALEKSTDPAVKGFADRMIKDHSAIDDEIANLARSKNLKLPDGPSLKQKATYELLKARSGASFDKAFMEHNVSDHEQDIKDFTEEAKGTSDADVKTFALATLKTLNEHLDQARKVSSATKTADK